MSLPVLVTETDYQQYILTYFKDKVLLPDGTYDQITAEELRHFESSLVTKLFSQDVTALTARVTSLEGSVASINTQLTTQASQISSLSTQFTTLQNSVNLVITDHQNQLNALFATTSTHTGQLALTQTSAVKVQLDSLNSTVGSLSTTVANHTTQISTINSSLTTLGNNKITNGLNPDNVTIEVAQNKYIDFRVNGNSRLKVEEGKVTVFPNSFYVGSNIFFGGPSSTSNINFSFGTFTVNGDLTVPSPYSFTASIIKNGMLQFGGSGASDRTSIRMQIGDSGDGPGTASGKVVIGNGWDQITRVYSIAVDGVTGNVSINSLSNPGVNFAVYGTSRFLGSVAVDNTLVTKNTTYGGPSIEAGTSGNYGIVRFVDGTGVSKGFIRSNTDGSLTINPNSSTGNWVKTTSGFITPADSISGSGVYDSVTPVYAFVGMMSPTSSSSPNNIYSVARDLFVQVGTNLTTASQKGIYAFQATGNVVIGTTSSWSSDGGSKLFVDGPFKVSGASTFLNGSTAPITITHSGPESSGAQLGININGTGGGRTGGIKFTNSVVGGVTCLSFINDSPGLIFQMWCGSSTDLSFPGIMGFQWVKGHAHLGVYEAGKKFRIANTTENFTASPALELDPSTGHLLLKGGISVKNTNVQPTTTDIPEGYSKIWYNSGTGIPVLYVYIDDTWWGIELRPMMP